MDLAEGHLGVKNVVYASTPGIFTPYIHDTATSTAGASGNAKYPPRKCQVSRGVHWKSLEANGFQLAKGNLLLFRTQRVGLCIYELNMGCEAAQLILVLSSTLAFRSASVDRLGAGGGAEHCCSYKWDYMRSRLIRYQVCIWYFSGARWKDLWIISGWD